MTSFQESVFPSPQEENGTYQSTSLGPSPPALGCDLGREQQSTCTSTALIAAFPHCPHHTAQRGLQILTPSSLCREASGCTRESLQHGAELGVWPQQQVWVLLAWHSLKIPEEKIGIAVTGNEGRSRAGTM